MIASVRGRVLAVRLDGAVVEVGGVGLLVQATPAALADLRVGAEAVLHTSLVVREDALTLFGFADADERECFEVLQTVTGVGPRLALAVLAVHTPEQLRRAVAADDLTALVRVPGIGRKGAARMVLELADRIGAPVAAVAPPPSSSSAAVPAPRAAPPSPLVDALVGLGWSAKQAEDAVAAVTAEAQDGGATVGGADGGAGGAAAPEDLPALLRAALRHLGGR